MTEISNKFKAKRGLDVTGDAIISGNLDVAGNLTAVTKVSADNTTNVATTAFVKTAIADLVASAPGTLDTLNELALALGNDPNFATTVTNTLATKAPLASAVLTGIPTAPTAAALSSTPQLATTAFVTSADNLKANIDSPALTGTPVAPSATIDTNTTQLATTAFVIGQAATVAPLMDGVATVGTSKLYARQDHIHASDSIKAPLVSPALTGVPTAPTATPLTGTTQLATTAYVDTADNLKSNIDSPVFTGTPAAPTATFGTSTTQLATTAFATGAIVNKADIANPSFTGDVKFSNGIGSADYTTIPVPGGARYSAPSSPIVGAFKITLPVLYTDALVSFTVSINELSTGSAFELKLSGNNSSSIFWTNVSASILGSSDGKTPSIRFGNDGTKTCIWIGDLADTWVWPNISIRNVQLSNGQSAAWLSGWSVAPVATFDTVKVGPIVPFKTAGLVSAALTGIPTAPTAAPNTTTAQLATTAFATAADNILASGIALRVTGVTATAPVVSSGGVAPVISIPAATASVNGYMSSAYASKIDGIAAGATANGTGTVSGINTGDQTNISGNAATVTTNANLTGPVTSVGNVTSIAPGVISNAMLSNSAVGFLSGINTGDQTNISGNAATVTTNANLTGPVTSVGNVTSIAPGVISNAMLSNSAVGFLSGINTGDQVLPTVASLGAEIVANKDTSGGYAGLTGLKLNLKNAANTITSWLTTVSTAARTWTFPDRDITVAGVDDITGGTRAGSFTSLVASGILTVANAVAASSYSGAGTGLTGTANGLNIGGSAANITGIAAVANGGTNATTAAQSRINLNIETGATGSTLISTGTTAQRDAVPTQGGFRFNITTGKYEGYKGASWGSVGGGATGGGSDEVFIENSTVVTTSYTLTAGKNASCIGPLTINSGVTVTIPTGARLVIF